MGLFDNLNPQQQQAVRHTASPLMVIAGAGSGKTRVITSKICYMIQALGIKPERILAITFTRKAAGEMQERVKSMLDIKPQWVLTFHAFCLRLLRQEINRLPLGCTGNFIIYDESDSISIIKNIMRRLEWDHETPEVVRDNISRAKQIYIPDMSIYELLYGLGGIQQEIAGICREYQSELKKSNALDYDDLLYFTTGILTKSERARRKWSSAFDYILIDEYQDTNKIQYQITQLMTSTHKNITVVGDPQQSIYSFRGAYVDNILKFRNDFEPRIIKLEENYRSTPQILEFANKIVLGLSDVWKENVLKLWTERRENGSIEITRLSHSDRENTHIAGKIKELMQDGLQYRDFAVLVRVSFLSRGLEETFLEHGIPCELIGGLEFFDRAEIKDMIAYLRFFTNVNDRIAFDRIINTPKRGLGAKTLGIIKEKYRTSWIRALRDALPNMTPQQQNSVQGFIQLCDKYGLQAENRPYTALMELIDDLRYFKYLESHYKKDSEGRVENISELANLLKRVEDEGGTFSDFYDDNMALVSAQDGIDDDNKVKIMTVHAAKGLEFPVVFITAMEEGIFPHARSMFKADSMEEERRLFYVAVTRAKQYLYITSSKRRNKFGKTSESDVSSFIAMLKEDVTVIDETPETDTEPSERLERELQEAAELF